MPQNTTSGSCVFARGRELEAQPQSLWQSWGEPENPVPRCQLATAFAWGPAGLSHWPGCQLASALISWYQMAAPLRANWLGSRQSLTLLFLSRKDGGIQGLAGPTPLHKECEIHLESLGTVIPVLRDHRECRLTVEAFFKASLQSPGESTNFPFLNSVCNDFKILPASRY